VVCKRARRAAVLFLADLYLGRAAIDKATQSQYEALGARFVTQCPNWGAGYSSNFLYEAEKLDPQGPIGELARLGMLANPCLLKGDKPWADLLLTQTRELLQKYPESKWAHVYHFALGRAEEVKLAYSYTGADDIDASGPVTPAQAPGFRSGAIEQFRLFLKQDPDGADAHFAWQEAWRLLAGLPPTRASFGCGCE